MANEPRIVAELGRPETPEETAARKAENTRRYHSSKTFRNLLAAMLVTLAIVAVMYFSVGRGQVSPPEEADVAAAAEVAETSMLRPVVSPETPEGWRVNSAGIENGVWRVVYAPRSGFVRLAQGFDVADTWATTMLDGQTPVDTVTIDGVQWDEYRLGGDADSANISYGLSARAGEDTILIYGKTTAEDAAQLASAVTAELDRTEKGQQ